MFVTGTKYVKEQKGR